MRNHAAAKGGARAGRGGQGYLIGRSGVPAGGCVHGGDDPTAEGQGGVHAQHKQGARGAAAGRRDQRQVPVVRRRDRQGRRRGGVGAPSRHQARV